MNNDLTERNKNINRGYRKLVVWQESVSLYVFVVKRLNNLSGLPFKVRAQIEDSILSVSSNISEGYSRRSLKETIKYNNYSLSSLSENYTQIYAQLKIGRIDQDWFDTYDQKHYSLENKLIALNIKQINLLNEKSDWRNDYLLREDEPSYDE